MSGPNEGYGYVASQGYYAARFRHVNERLFRDGPADVPDTVNGQNVGVSHWTYLARRGKNPAELLDGVMGHEGHGHNGMKGHQGQIEKALTLDACGDVSAIADRIVARDRGRAEKVLAEAEVAADKAFAMAVGHNHVYGNLGPAGSPTAYWAPGRQPRVSVAYDRYDPNDIRRYWEPGCSWAFF